MLNDRERQVIQGIFHGQTNREIGVALGTTEQCVKNALAQAYRKLGVNHVRQLFPLVIEAKRELAEKVA